MDKRISQRRLTVQRHTQQTCKVFECKADFSHLSTASVKHLTSLFVEAKWFYNYCLGFDNIDQADTTAKQVPVKTQKGFEDRNLSVLSSQMKQAIKTRLFGSLSSLKSRKANGYKVGRLKFKSRLHSIPLKQFGVTYDIDFDKQRIRLQGLKQWVRVRGLRQIPKEAEIANATLVKKASGYYFLVTTFVDKVEKQVPEASIGIDFGCQTPLTLSNGTKVEFSVPVPRQIKQLDHRIARQDKSRNKQRNYFKRERQYEKLTNKKKDIRHKIVSAITKCFKYVCFQDESIHAWHAGNHGKKIQATSIGGIMSDLKRKSHTPIEVSKWFPSTQLCPACGALNKLGLGERTYRCDCGYVADRDWKSSFCIETEGMKKVPTEHRYLKVQESSTSTFLDILINIDGVVVKQVGLDKCTKPTALVSQLAGERSRG